MDNSTSNKKGAGKPFSSKSFRCISRLALRDARRALIYGFFCKTSKRYWSSISNGKSHFVLPFPYLQYSSFKNRKQIKWATTRGELLLKISVDFVFLFCFVISNTTCFCCLQMRIFCMHVMNCVFSIMVFFYAYLRFTRSQREMGRLLLTVSTTSNCFTIVDKAILELYSGNN